MSLAPWISRLGSPWNSSSSKSSRDQKHGSTFNNSTTKSKSDESPGSYSKSYQSMEATEESTSRRPPYFNCMLAGGIGGTTGDLLMHSIDTVKTRQQGDPHMPPKYGSLSSTYVKIFRQEGIRRGLYGGVFPAFLGSFPGTLIFFGTYEYSKRTLIDLGMNDSIAYLSAGLIADLAASTVYVPSEVLKTRLQLQGRYNNPHFSSGYNYRSTFDATKTIIRTEGVQALFYGYRATLWRDMPFSALQFAFYEQNQKWAKQWVSGRDIGLSLEILTGAAAGGLAGILTCPLDVVKTRIQTQINPTSTKSQPAIKQNLFKPLGSSSSRESLATSKALSTAPQHLRSIVTSSTPSAMPKAGAATLDTSSILTGLKLIYKTEGLAGWFRGVAPRFVWTSVQSGTMLVMYQILLRQLEKRFNGEEPSHSAYLSR